MLCDVLRGYFTSSANSISFAQWVVQSSWKAKRILLGHAAARRQLERLAAVVDSEAELHGPARVQAGLSPPGSSVQGMAHSTVLPVHDELRDPPSPAPHE